MHASVKDIIHRRKSVQTFSGEALRYEDRQKLGGVLRVLDNPFGLPVEFRFIDAKEHVPSSSVIVEADEYAGAKVNRAPQSDIAFGYSFKKFCLFAEPLDIGTVMLAAALSRDAFEKAMEVRDTEVMPAARPIGYRKL